MSDRVRVETPPPRHERQLLISGWSVPLIEALEEDGGNFLLVLDGRFGLEVDTAHFERVAEFVANVIATCWGYGSHPRDEDFEGDHAWSLPRHERFRRVPHPSLQPHRVVEVTGFDTEEVGPEDAA